MNAIDRKLLARLERKQFIGSAEKEALEARFEHCQGTLFRELLPLNLVDELELAKSYARACGLPFLDLRKVEPDAEVVNLLNKDQRASYQALPVGYAEGKLIIAIQEAQDVLQLDRLQRLLPREEIQVVLTIPSALKSALDAFAAPPLRPSASSTKTGSGGTRPTTNSSAQTHEEPTLHERDTIREEHKTAKSFNEQETHIEDEAQKTRRERETRFSLGNPKNVPISSDELPKLDFRESNKAFESLMKQAVANRAEELELDVTRVQSLICLRQEGVWSKLAELSHLEGKKLFQELRAGATRLEGDEEHSTGLLEFVEKGKRHRAILYATNQGERIHARLLFPANLTILQKPLRLLGAQPVFRERLEPFLEGRLPGVGLSVSCNDEMALRQMVASLAFLAQTGGMELEILALQQGLQLPKTREKVFGNGGEFVEYLASLSGSGEHSLLIAHQIPDTPSFQGFFGHQYKGNMLGSFLSRDAESARRVLGAHREQLKFGHLHLHLWRAPKLCGSCKELALGTPEQSLPEWLKPLEAHDIHEAPGCKECGNRGTKGSVWVSELAAYNTSQGDFEVLADYRQTLRTLITEGMISLNEVLAQWE
ncbi:MAG: hypothetical protein SFY68_14965 [Candidatus Sumerlaeia bacterium]|nr:hypothetical protein [Candidatus Sumerlaeia bacterium]